MKKMIIFFTLCSLFFLTSCGKDASNEDPRWIKYYAIDWENMEKEYGDVPFRGKDIIPDEESAISVARSILSNISNNYKNNHEDLTGVSVLYVHKYNMWVVSFYHTDPPMMGGGICIALRKDNGQVLRVWATE